MAKKGCTVAPKLEDTDLLILPEGKGMYFQDQDITELKSYLDRGGALFAVQPMSKARQFPQELEKVFGVQNRGWSQCTPTFSQIRSTYYARRLGITAGETVNPHRNYWGHLNLETTNADIITCLGETGVPDIVQSRSVRAVISTTDLFHDLTRYSRNPEFRRYEQQLSTLFTQIVGNLFGMERIEGPLNRLLIDNQTYFYGMGMGYQYLYALDSQEENRLPGYDNLRQAAGSLLKGRYQEYEQKYRLAANGLKEAIGKHHTVQPYFVRGWHGGIVFDDFRETGLIGYAEWGWPEYTIDWIDSQIAFARKTGISQINEVPGQTWEIVAKYHNDKLNELRKAAADGVVESVKGMYSDSYLEIHGPESNIRQFKYGIEVIEKVFGSPVHTFLCAFDDYAFHPQVPQILKSFGFRNAVLRCGGESNAEGFHVGGLYEPWVAGYPGPRVTPSCFDKTIETRDNAETTARMILTESTEYLARRINTARLDGEGEAIVVFNPFGWNVRKTITVELRGIGKPNRFEAHDSGGQSLPVWIMDTRTQGDDSLYTLRIICAVPPLGYETVTISPICELSSETDASGGNNCNSQDMVLDNDFFLLEVNPKTGGIKRILDKQADREILQTEDFEGLELFCENDLQSFHSKNQTPVCKVVEDGFMGKSMQIRGNIASLPYTFTVNLRGDCARIDIDLEIDFGEGSILGFKMAEETALQMVFPFAFDGKWFISQPFGIYESHIERQVCSEFVSYRGESYACTVLQLATPGVRFDKRSLLFTIADGFPPARNSKFYRWSLFPHKPDAGADVLMRRFKEFAEDFIVVKSGRHTGDLPLRKAFCNPCRGRALISTLFAEDGYHYLRVYDLSGETDQIDFEIDFDGEVEKVSFRNAVLQHIDTVGTKLKAVLEPWEIATFRWPLQRRTPEEIDV